MQSVKIDNFMTMDTSHAKNLTDEKLLDFISQVEFYGGWGLVAELMKRYQIKVIDTRKTSQ